jgi:hypothetical protein
VPCCTSQGGHHGQATGVFLRGGVVQPLSGGDGTESGLRGLLGPWLLGQGSAVLYVIT